MRTAIPEMFKSLGVDPVHQDAREGQFPGEKNVGDVYRAANP
jgi:hypothetical protein